MPRAHVRGGRKEHNRRLRHRRLMTKHLESSIESLRVKIFEEAKQRYEEEQAKPAQIKTND